MAMTETTLYYVIMIAIYSGLLPWVIGQLTRSRDDDRRAARETVDGTLALVERLRTARAAAVDPARQASIDVMIKRLQAEADDKVAELNASSELEINKPSRRYIVIPTPRTGFGVMLTVMFGASVYFAILLLLTIAFMFWNPPVPNLVSNVNDQWAVGLLVGGSFILVALAILFRAGAYRSYDRAIERMKEEVAAAKAV